MERLTKETKNGGLVWYPKNNSGLPEYVTKNNPYREICEKLKAYEDLEEQGLLLRLPCKVGDTVYEIKDYLDCEYNYNCPLGYAEGKYNCEKGYYCNHKYKRFFTNETPFDIKMIDKIGKTVFLTREEAEAALEKMKGEEHE